MGLLLARHLPRLLPSSHPLMTRRLRRQAEPGKALPSTLILYSHSPSLLISFTTSPPPPLPPILSPPPPPPPLAQEVHKGPKHPCPAPLTIPTLLAPLTCSAHCSLQQEAPSFLSPGPIIPWGCEFGWAQRLIECWITLSRTLTLCLIVAAAEKRTDTNGVWISMCLTTQRERQQNMDWWASRR